MSDPERSENIIEEVSLSATSVSDNEEYSYILHAVNFPPDDIVKNNLNTPPHG